MFIEAYFCLGLRKHRLWINASKLSVLSEFPHSSSQYITRDLHALYCSYPVFPRSLCFVLRQHASVLCKTGEAAGVCRCSAGIAKEFCQPFLLFYLWALTWL